MKGTKGYWLRLEGCQHWSERHSERWDGACRLQAFERTDLLRCDTGTVCLCADMRRDREKTTRQYANNLHPHPAADYRNPKNIVSSVQSFVLARPSSHLQFTSYSFSNIYKINMIELGTKYRRNNARLSLQWNRLSVLVWTTVFICFLRLCVHRAGIKSI